MQEEKSVMNDYKITIARSYSRKVNLQNYDQTRAYENIDFFSSYSKELPVETSREDLKKESDALFEMAKEDVEALANKVIEKLRQ
jgi:hypothetical protein